MQVRNDKQTRSLPMANLPLLAGLILIYSQVTAEVDNNLPDDQSVLLDDTATFKFCSTLYPISYSINRMRSHELPEHFKNKVTFDSNSSPCHFLSFPAWLEYDGALIQFHYRNASSRIATLHIQGVLGPPENLKNVKLNSTHDSLIWDDPQSLLGHENTTYHVVFTSGHLNESFNVRDSSYIYLRQTARDVASVAAWNPVGEGTPSTLDLSESLNGCKNMDDIAPVALPYLEDGSMSALVKLWEIYENLVYCFDFITVTSTWRDPTRHLPLIEDNTAVIRLHNIPEERHLQIDMMFDSSQYNVNLSTYAVQDVTSTDDHVMHTCRFLKGALTDTCFILVYYNDVFSHYLSGSESYTLNVTEGNFTLKIYDDETQMDRHIDPAKEISFVISPKEEKRKDKGSISLVAIVVGALSSGLLGVGLLLISVVGVAVVVWKCRMQQQSKVVTESRDTETESRSDMESGLIYQKTVVPGTLPGLIHRTRTQPTRINAPCRNDFTSDSEVNESTTDHFNLSDGGPTIESRAVEVLEDLKTGACLQYPEPVRAVN